MSNTECRIDSLAPSWSVLSGVGDVDRSHRAMEAVDKFLVRRENGGQYAHAAIWTAMAFAAMAATFQHTLLTAMKYLKHQ